MSYLSKAVKDHLVGKNNKIVALRQAASDLARAYTYFKSIIAKFDEETRPNLLQVFKEVSSVKEAYHFAQETIDIFSFVEDYHNKLKNSCTAFVKSCNNLLCDKMFEVLLLLLLALLLVP